MTNEHPITPPPELLDEWLEYGRKHRFEPGALAGFVAENAARWGSDTELGVCCKWLVLNGYGEAASRLRVARCTPPPSLKEQALATLQKLSASGYPCDMQQSEDWDTIRRALEQLDD